jgi:DNA-binding HxlR family transcriptional regulator
VPKTLDNRPPVADAATASTTDALYQIESPMERAMELIGDKYSFLIVHILHQFEKQRFVELEDQILGISPRTLSARLKHLEAYGLVHRHQYPTIPPRVEYTLTERGKDLANTMNELIQWTNRWYAYQPR